MKKTTPERIKQIKKILAQIIEGKREFKNTKLIVLRLYNMLYKLGDSEGKKEFISLMQDSYVKRKEYTRKQKLETLHKAIRMINEGKLIVNNPKRTLHTLNKHIDYLLIKQNKLCLHPLKENISIGI